MPRAPHTQGDIDAVAALPAGTIARRAKDGTGWVLDLGPASQVGDASPGIWPTPDAVKAWLLDDLTCTGKLGKPQYQPHWDSYDLRYRLLAYWRAKQWVLEHADPNRKGLHEALAAACVSLKDLAAGWPRRELHEPVQHTLDRAKRLGVDLES